MKMRYALINKTVATLYGRAAFDDIKDKEAGSTIQDEALYGMPVKITEEINEKWVKVCTHYNYEGYMAIEDLYPITENEMKNYNNSLKQFVLKRFADVLSLPKVQGIRLKELTRGAVVDLLQPALEKGGWAKVRLNDGKEGYIKEGYLGNYYENPSSDEEDILRENLISSAKAYMGTQYRWGGKSTLGIDCSGLCSMAYLLNGIRIYRDAKIKEGFPIHKIKYEMRKKGDLLYFPGHIAMYLGDDYYIHSTGKNESDGVVINSLNPENKLYRPDLAKNMYAVGSYF